MDPRYHVAAFRGVRQLVSGAQSASGVRAGAVTLRGDRRIQRPNRRLARRIGCVCTGDRGRNSCDRRDQGSAYHSADRRRARAAAENCAVQRRTRFHTHRDQVRRTDQFDRGHTALSDRGGDDSEGDPFEPISTNRRGCHIGEVVSVAMCAVRRQDVEEGLFHPLCVSPIKRPLRIVMARRSRGKALTLAW